MVIVPGRNGQLGILPHHTPLISSLGVGELRIKKGGSEESMLISGGFVEVRPDKVIVMADLAEHSDEIDEAKRRRGPQARRGRARAEQGPGRHRPRPRRAPDRAHARADRHPPPLPGLGPSPSAHLDESVTPHLTRQHGPDAPWDRRPRCVADTGPRRSQIAGHTAARRCSRPRDARGGRARAPAWPEGSADAGHRRMQELRKIGREYPFICPVDFKPHKGSPPGEDPNLRTACSSRTTARTTAPTTLG